MFAGSITKWSGHTQMVQNCPNAKYWQEASRGQGKLFFLEKIKILYYKKYEKSKLSE